jgi:hypothetical protein
MIAAPIIHKNNDRAVSGFDAFNKTVGEKFTLFLTSSYDDATKERLAKLSDKVEFLGNISDAELADAYKGASCLLFPSLAEGLGMPILEAVQWGIPIACSDIPVFSELSTSAFYLFDPLDSTSIANALKSATSREEWHVHHDAYRDIEAKYTWDRTASLVADKVGTYSPTPKTIHTVMALTIPDPRAGTPGGTVGQSFFMRASQEWDVYLKCTGLNADREPAFASYLQSDVSASPDTQTQLRFRDAGILERWRYGKNSIIIEGEVEGRKVSSVFGGSKKIIDRALSVTSWRATLGKQELTTDSIYDLVANNDKGVEDE